MSGIGQQVRRIREQRGLGLAEFAAELGVSPHYLRNLETGRTSTIQLEILRGLQSELSEKLEAQEEREEARVSRRIERAAGSLQTLYRVKPQSAEYLLRMLEQGLELSGQLVTAERLSVEGS